MERSMDLFNFDESFVAKKGFVDTAKGSWRYFVPFGKPQPQQKPISHPGTVSR